MSQSGLEQVIQAVLYEGHILYPYRPSSAKNQGQRFTFGRVYPQDYADAQCGAEPCAMQTECLFTTQTENAALEVSVRFLQPMLREIGVLHQPKLKWDGLVAKDDYQVVPSMMANGEIFQTWHEAVERVVRVPSISICRQAELAGCGRIALQMPLEFAASCSTEPVRDKNQIIGVIARHQEMLKGAVEVLIKRSKLELFTVTVRVINQTPALENCLNDDEAIMMRTFASAHVVLEIKDGNFLSLLEPGAKHANAASKCRNIGVWPVLVGDEEKHETHTILASPIILYDYPKIAAESPGTLYDGTEIDEILTLRIMTMTDQEKLEMRNVDAHACRLLERTEALTSASLLNLHGKMHRPGAGPNEQSGGRRSAEPTPSRTEIEFDDFFGVNVQLKGAFAGGNYIQRGDRVRIHPRGRADLIDIALEGQTAVVEAVEQDLENRIHLAVVFEKDPGKDLGMLRQPGHRFFYGLDEIEPVLEGVR